MYTFLVVLHLLVCFFLIFIVLIQSSKGAEMGSTFGGGSSQTLFGGRGATTFLAKLTTSVAILFMITSLTLAFYSIKRTSIVSDVPAQQETKAPLTDTAGPVTATPDVAPATETPAAK
ncbi:MAG: preprotein translocase subunit SecG [Thermodesulfovibrionia bacterium]|nr:preprotein translocase subunit SecG [Thermodesulfovibrionia bacterium]